MDKKLQELITKHGLEEPQGGSDGNLEGMRALLATVQADFAGLSAAWARLARRLRAQSLSLQALLTTCVKGLVQLARWAR